MNRSLNSGADIDPDSAIVAPVPRISIHAFCETTAIAGAIEASAQDRRMDKAQLKVEMGGAALAVETFRGAPTPNLIVLESLAGDGPKLLGMLDDLAESCDPGTKVIVIGHVNDVPLYRELIPRLRSVELAGPPAYMQTLFVGGPKHLPIRYAMT